MTFAPHSPPFRAELIGSLVRPQAIKDARQKYDEGRLTDTELRALEDEEIQKVIALQENYGFRVVTDGELRRKTYSDSFTTHGITGLELGDDIGGTWSYTNGGETIPGDRLQPQGRSLTSCHRDISASLHVMR